MTVSLLTSGSDEGLSRSGSFHRPLGEEPGGERCCRSQIYSPRNSPLENTYTVPKIPPVVAAVEEGKIALQSLEETARRALDVAPDLAYWSLRVVAEDYYGSEWVKYVSHVKVG